MTKTERVLAGISLVFILLFALSFSLNIWYKFGNVPTGEGEIERGKMQVKIDSLLRVVDAQDVLIDDYKAKNDSLKILEVEPKIIKQTIIKKSNDEIKKYNALPPNGRVQSWSDRARE